MKQFYYIVSSVSRFIKEQKASGILDSLAYIFTTSIPDLHLLVVFPILVEKLNMKNNAVSGAKKLRFIKDQKV